MKRHHVSLCPVIIAIASWLSALSTNAFSLLGPYTDWMTPDLGYHQPGDITVHTTKVLEQMKSQLEACGSSMEKVLKVNVYLNDLKDYAGMNEVFLGKFGPEPGVRTTVAPAGGIPGNSLVEIDCIASL